MASTPEQDSVITWPPALVLPPWAAALTWRTSDALAAGLAGSGPPTGSPTRLCPREPVLLQGQPLAATLVFELDVLVRIELRGVIDELAALALGASADTQDDEGHHHLWLALTRVTLDTLDGVLALEPADP